MSIRAVSIICQVQTAVIGEQAAIQRRQCQRLVPMLDSLLRTSNITQGWYRQHPGQRMIWAGSQRTVEVDQRAVVVMKQKSFEVAVGCQSQRVLPIELDRLGRELHRDRAVRVRV